MLTVLSMENLIVGCKLNASLRDVLLAGICLLISKIIDIGWNYRSFSLSLSLLSDIHAPSF